MAQQTGETRDAIIKDDEKIIAKMVEHLSYVNDIYWIVLFAKTSKQKVDGKPTLIKHIKAYFKKPIPQVGMIIGEVDNKSGTISWEINMPQAPFDFLALGAKESDKPCIETTTIPNAYVTS